MFAVLYLMFGLPVFLVTYVVLFTVLRRSGHSRLWVLAPLAVVVLLIFRALGVETGTGAAALSSDPFEAVTVGVWLACFLGWLSLIVIACLRFSEGRDWRRTHPRS